MFLDLLPPTSNYLLALLCFFCFYLSEFLDIYTNMLTSIAKNAEQAKQQLLTGKGVVIVGSNQKPADSCCMDSLFSES